MATGCVKALELQGQTFGRLTAVSVVGLNKHQLRLWKCVCTCGNTKVFPSSRLTRGHAKSCGCLKRESNIKRFTTHGNAAVGRRMPEYNIRAAIIQRCENPKTGNYDDYGGRGIKICGAWRSDFRRFLSDMGPRPSPSHSIERRDNDGDYEPGNCFWATRAQQSRNTRRTRWVEVGGLRLTFADASSLYGIAASTVKKRLQNGWSLDRAFGVEVSR